MSDPRHDRHAARERQLRGEVTEATRADILAEARSKGPEQARRRVQRLLEEQLRRLPAAARQAPACRAGCAFCCHLRVMATPAEVFGLLDFLQRSLDASAFEQFVARVRAAAGQVRAQPRGKLLSTNIACPALVDGACSGYPARPLNCRSYHSLDRSACEASFAAPADFTIGHPQNRAEARVHEGVQGGFVQGLAAAGFDARQVELVTALEEAIDDPGARQRLAAGQQAFLRPSPL